MSNLLQTVQQFQLATSKPSIEEIENGVRQVAQFGNREWAGHERRAHARFPYAKLITLVPVDGETLEQVGETMHVVGKNLAVRGIDFFHTAPMPSRFAVVSLEIAPSRWLHLLLKIYWCRFRQSGWYDSGGEFIKAVEPIDPSIETGF